MTPRCQSSHFLRIQSRNAAFTLVEILTVIAVMAALLSLVVPAFSKVSSARQMALAAYSIEGMMETARAYAKANNTYTWVGFYEEDGSQSSPNPSPHGNSVGRIVVSVVASKDGTAIGTTPLDPTRLTQVYKLVKLDNIHLADLSSTDVATRAAVPGSSYQVGDASFAQSGSPKATFNYPISGTSTYTFEKIIQFSPVGDAIKILDSPVPLMEVGLRPTHAATVDAASRDCVAVQVSGINGALRVYQP